MARAQCDWSGDEIRRVGYRAVDLIADYLTGLPGRPLFRPYPPDLIQECSDAVPPQTGPEMDTLLDQFVAMVAAYPCGNGHPQFFEWANSPRRSSYSPRPSRPP